MAARTDLTAPSGGFCDCSTSGGGHRGEYSGSRRALLRSGFAAAASLALGLGTEIVRPVTARADSGMAPTSMTPDQALAELIAGNKRFQQQQLTSFNEDLKLLKQQTAAGQAPFAALLSCANSRVPVELAFDQTIGRLFVTRVAGNIATAEMIASLEYGAAVLGAKAIMVLGHASCGAVEATIAGKPVPGQISALYRCDPAGGRPGRAGPRGRGQGERPHPGRAAAHRVAGLRRPRRQGPAQDRRRVLRPRERRGHAARLSRGPSRAAPGMADGRG